MNNGLQPALVRDGYRSRDGQAQLCESYEVGQVETFEVSVVRDVKEDRFDAFQSCHAGYRALDLALVRALLFLSAKRELPDFFLEAFRGNGSFIMRRIDATCSGLTPKCRPISSGVGTGLEITCTAM